MTCPNVKHLCKLRACTHLSTLAHANWPGAHETTLRLTHRGDTSPGAAVVLGCAPPSLAGLLPSCEGAKRLMAAFSCSSNC